MSENQRSTVPIILLILLTYMIVMSMIAASHSQVRNLQRRVAELEQRK